MYQILPLCCFVNLSSFNKFAFNLLVIIKTYPNILKVTTDCI